jgi:hypothetical protein
MFIERSVHKIELSSGDCDFLINFLTFEFFMCYKRNIPLYVHSTTFLSGGFHETQNFQSIDCHAAFIIGHLRLGPDRAAQERESSL